MHRLDLPEASIVLAMGDITTQSTDVIVNAANESLAPGGGVCGAIHSTGGPTIARECRDIGYCPTGEARATSGGNLPCRWVIHAVGPVWRDGLSGEPALLAGAYRASMDLAALLGATSVALPAISTGIYGFPIDLAALIALRAVRDRLLVGGPIRLVTFVLFSEPALAAFEGALQSVAETQPPP